MEREGKGEGRGRRGGEGRRRGGGEMRKGIIVGGMILSLLLRCNNGGEDPQKVFLKSIVSLGSNFLDVFTSFGEMAGSALGFKKDPKKSDVASYFKNIQKTVQGTKEKLEKIVADMEKENNPNAAAVKTKVDELINNKLSKIMDGASVASEAIGTEGAEPIGNVATAGSGGGAGEVDKLDKLVEGIKDIVKLVLKSDEGNADAGDDKKSDDGNTQRNNDAGEAGKLFTNAQTGGDKKPAADAAKAVGAVTGADILQAIAKEGGDSVKLAKHNGNHGTITNTSQVATNAKDAVIAGAIALRAMAKGGKFANGNGGGQDMSTAVKSAAASAVTKALNTLTIAIKKTIDEGLKKVKEAMNISPETTPVTTEAKNQ